MLDVSFFIKCISLYYFNFITKQLWGSTQLLIQIHTTEVAIEFSKPKQKNISVIFIQIMFKLLKKNIKRNYFYSRLCYTFLIILKNCYIFYVFKWKIYSSCFDINIYSWHVWQHICTHSFILKFINKSVCQILKKACSFTYNFRYKTNYMSSFIKYVSNYDVNIYAGPIKILRKIF